MKTNIILNIGLEASTGKAVELHHAIHEIERAGVACLASGVVAGVWEGKAEQTLVICGLAYDSPELLPRLYCASRALSQHCIAVWRDGKGELIGDNPKGYAFNPSLFHFHPRETCHVVSLEAEIETAYAVWEGTIDGQELVAVFENETEAETASRSNREYYVERVPFHPRKSKPRELLRVAVSGSQIGEFELRAWNDEVASLVEEISEKYPSAQVLITPILSECEAMQAKHRAKCASL